MSGVVERYLLLGLRLGRHVDGLVDAYYGPAELAAAVEAEPLVAPQALVEEAASLLAETEGWLHDQVRGLRTYAGVLAGEDVSYADEVEGCYGVRPQRVSEEIFAAAHERLAALLPGEGALADRFEAWRQAQIVPSDRVVGALEAVVRELRGRTRALVGLPDGEDVELESVRDEPWLAFNYYRGGLRSRVVVNIDLPIAVGELVHLGAHEAYPGHHAEHAWKESRLVQGRGLLEEAILLVPTPQALVSEGIAEAGAELVLDSEAGEALTAILHAEGVAYDAAETAAIRAAREPLALAATNAALMLHEDAAGMEEARGYLERWTLQTRVRAEKSIAFLTDPTWRAYATTYTEGLRLCRAYVAGDAAALARLLTEQVTIGELVSAVDGGAAISSRP
ncbi:MAG: hypothetical protein ACRDM9_08970 [Gaiellaceae bacterium]